MRNVVDSLLRTWDDGDMSLHFWIIISIQFLFFVFLYMRAKMPIVALLKLLTISMFFGVIFGFIFDSVFGLLGLFSYVHMNGSASLYSTGLSATQIAINGILSYGLAAATTYFIVPKRSKIKRFNFKKIVAISLLVAAVASAIGLYFLEHDIYSLFLGGLVVITLGEAVALLCDESGPFLSLARTRRVSVFVVFWVNSVAIGLLYELANYFFPFWMWLPGGEYSHLLVELLVIMFGYVVLIHPMVIFWQIVQKNK